MGDVTQSSPGFIFSTASEPGSAAAAGLSISKPDDDAKCPILRLLIGHCTTPNPKRVTQYGVTDRCYEEERENESPNDSSAVRPVHTGQFFLRPEFRSSIAVIGSINKSVSGVCFSAWKRLALHAEPHLAMQ